MSKLKYPLFGLCFALAGWGCAGGPSSVVRTPYPVTGPVSVVGPTAVRAPHDVRHVVGPSETLWRIAKTYDVDMETILKVNHLKDSTSIRSGQTLLIPNTQGAKQLIPLYPSQRWTHIIVHHTATDKGDSFTIDGLHHKRGWDRGLGYHFIVNNGTSGKEDGQIQVGPRWVKQLPGAHTKASNMNDHGIGIGIVGNFSEHFMTETELSAIVFLVKTLQQYYHIPDQNVMGHRDVPGAATECPGKLFPWHEFKRRIAS
ncbi:MAG: N-acetylmuramoyl-L-alanine amidase [Candidatus Omnitrophota bacterium]